jgi:DNA polymerase-3 subunit beta
MEFNVERITFLEGIQKTLGIVERKTTMPILNNILIRAGDTQIKIIATDREIGLISDYEADVVAPGEITIAARKLYEMIREIQGNVINFKKMDNNWVTITCGKIMYKVPGIAVDEFPEVADDQSITFSKIKSSLLKEMINKTYFAISTDEMRVNLNGIYFSVEQGLALMVATDGHRLSIVKKQMEDDGLSGIEGGGIILPRKGVGEIRKLVEDGTDDIEIGIQQGLCVIRKNKTVLRVSLIDSDYPDYEKVIPEEKGVNVRLDRDQLLHSLKRMGVMSSERFSGVKIELAENKMTLSSINPDVGEAKDEIDIVYEGKEFEMGYNVKYLIEAIDVVDEQDISIEMREAHGPGVIKLVDDDSYMCIIMPLRL